MADALYRSPTTAADDRIRAARAAVDERDHLIKVLALLEEDVAAEDQRAAELASTLDDEQRDVRRYERGLWAALYGLFADRDARLTKEQREAEAAAAKHAGAVASRDALRAQAAAIAARRDALGNADAELVAARAAKHALLVEQGAPTGDELVGIAGQLGAIDAQVRELDEAIAAGGRATAALEALSAVLSSARNWGKADLLSNSFLISWVKRSKLDDASSLAGTAQAELLAFHRELGDLGMSLDAAVNSAALEGRFLDTWFDNLFTDLDTQDRIIQAQRTASDAQLEVGVRIGQAQQRRAQLVAHATELVRSREALLDPSAAP